MKVKRFFAKDMRQAIRLVREDQGPDAVILSNRKVDGGVEIISALGYEESLLENAPAPTPSPIDEVDGVTYTPALAEREKIDVATPAEPARVAAAPAPEKSINWSQDPAIVAMRDEIRGLRDLLENQLAHLAWSDKERRDPVSTHIMRRLSRLELDHDLIEQLAARVNPNESTDTAWQHTQADLAAQIPVIEEDVIDQGGVVALIGSTGVGKTTSIAKLAARYVLRHGQRHVALVTTDGYRIGAHEQLMTYGRLLGIPVQVAADYKELRSTVQSLSEKRLVLIDTAGMSQRDVRLSKQFTTLADSGIPIRTLLVLPATAHASVLEETVNAFSEVPLDGAILTKVDEAASLGGALSALVNRHLPLMFTADGQRVPEDLHPARAQTLVQLASELAEQRLLPEKTMMAEQFGGFRENVPV